MIFLPRHFPRKLPDLSVSLCSNETWSDDKNDYRNNDNSSDNSSFDQIPSSSCFESSRIALIFLSDFLTNQTMRATRAVRSSSSYPSTASALTARLALNRPLPLPKPSTPLYLSPILPPTTTTVPRFHRAITITTRIVAVIE